MCRWTPVSVIYLRRPVARRLKLPTPRQWTSNPLLPVYLALQLTGCAASGVSVGAVGSYPAFSPLPRRAATGGCFLSHCPRGRPRLPVRMCDALCCPDFPRHGRCHAATDHATRVYFADARAVRPYSAAVFYGFALRWASIRETISESENFEESTVRS